MKTWLRAILWHLLSAPILRSVSWTDDEAKQFEVFYNSSCGRKLFELLRQTVASATFNAVYADGVSANARARGMQEIYALLIRLRSSFSPEAGSYDDASEDIEPLPSQKGAIDGRRFGLSGGNSAIR
jgi:hypothetical protein